ncbi:MAG: hypothetical protein JWP57_2225, partial [Spirosoma sp.]|nr:hypothetical protein [Spirosoma sp.]
VGKLLFSMNTCVGSAAAEYGHWPTEPLRQGCFNRGLDADSIGLCLPAVVGGAPIRKFNKITHTGQKYQRSVTLSTLKLRSCPHPMTMCLGKVISKAGF